MGGNSSKTEEVVSKSMTTDIQKETVTPPVAPAKTEETNTIPSELDKAKTEITSTQNSVLEEASSSSTSNAKKNWGKLKGVVGATAAFKKNVTLHEKKSGFWTSLEKFETRLLAMEFKQSEEHVRHALQLKGVFDSKGMDFISTGSDYYSCSLTERASFLSSSTGNEVATSHLCKTVLMENVSHKPHMKFQFISVMVQYEAKIETDMIISFILLSEKGCKKKDFNYQLASLEMSNQISGYKHNGVCPFGFQQEVPLFIDSTIMNFTERIFLGGGHPQLKLAILPSIIKQMALSGENDMFITPCSSARLY